MPSSHTLESLPSPDDPRVVLRRTPARRAAAVKFSGTWGHERFAAKAGELARRLKAEGLTPAGEPVIARYDPPWTPWFLRRNEVLIEVGGASHPPD
jgi:hypothetical protein